jgi:hypothetical protein
MCRTFGAKFNYKCEVARQGQTRPQTGAETKLGSVPAQRCVKRTGTDLPPMAAALRMRHAEAAAPSVAWVRLRSRYL